MKGFGKRIKELRQAAKITQSELSEILNIHPQTVSKWERELFEPDISQLGELASAFGITLEKLLGCEETDKSYVGSFQSESFGKLLSELRVAHGESQEELADALHASSDAVSRWERGVTCPDVEMLICIADHYEVPVSKLYCGFSDEDATESVMLVKKKRRHFAIWVSVAAVIGLLIGVTVFLLQPYQGAVSYTVTVEGEELSVGANEWFSPQIPEREGYVFMRWTDEDGKELTFPRKISGNCSVIAEFVPRKYAIDYWLNGGYFLQPPQNIFTVESGLLEIPIPKKSGADFEGWFVSPDYSGNSISQIQCNGEDVKLYAKWSDSVYTVRYELNGGILQGAENPETVTVGQRYDLNAPVRKGYVFLGWFDQAFGGDKYVSVGGTGAKNLTLYALWQKSDEIFTVFYDLDGGTTECENPVSVGAVKFINCTLRQKRVSILLVGIRRKTERANI